MSQDFFIFHLREYELIDSYFIPNNVLIIHFSESVQFNSENFFKPYNVFVFVFVFVKTFHWFCINWLKYSNFLLDKLSWVENMLCLCALRGGHQMEFSLEIPDRVIWRVWKSHPSPSIWCHWLDRFWLQFVSCVGRVESVGSSSNSKITHNYKEEGLMKKNTKIENP